MAVTQSQIEVLVRRLDPQFCGSEWAVRLSETAALAIDTHMPEECWGNAVVYKNAMAYWILHHLVLMAQADASPAMANAAGPVTSIRTMDESISFAAFGSGGGASQDAFFRRTTWGNRYLGLRNTRPQAHSFVI